ncbi:MAG TPA: Flp pilus assembly protein CpaB [Bacillota bacterium]
MRRPPLLAVGAALLTGMLIYAYLGALAGDLQAVVLAARDLPAGHRIAPEDVRVVELPARAVHGRAVDPSGVVGRILLQDVVADQQLLEPFLAPTGAQGPVAARLRDNHVAFFVPLSVAHALGGAVAPGDRIDLIFVAQDRYGDSPDAYVLVQGARVLEIRAEDGSLHHPAADRPRVPLGLLVEVRPADAARLAHALEHGSLYAVLPGPVSAGSTVSPAGPPEPVGGEPPWPGADSTGGAALPLVDPQPEGGGQP